MSENKLVWEDNEYDDVEDYLQNGFIELDVNDLIGFKEEMIESHCQGIYTIRATLEDNKVFNHDYIFIDRTYDNLFCIPIKIPKENMFNTDKKIINIEYDYEPFKISDYHTKRDELVDFDGKIIKKGKRTKSVTVDGVNFKVRPEKDYDLKDYLKEGFEMVLLDDFLSEQQELIKKHGFDGLYEIQLTLITGEQIHLYYYYCDFDKKQVYIYPLLEDNQLRNTHNIPEQYVFDIEITFYSKSKKLGLNKYIDINRCERFTNHIYEDINEGEYISVSTSNFTNEVLSLIKQYGNKGKLIYSFERNNGDSIEVIEETYEFVKFKKQYQYNEDFVILEVKTLPENNWYETELTDILSEKWEYVLD